MRAPPDRQDRDRPARATAAVMRSAVWGFAPRARHCPLMSRPSSGTVGSTEALANAMIGFGRGRGSHLSRHATIRWSTILPFASALFLSGARGYVSHHAHAACARMYGCPLLIVVGGSEENGGTEPVAVEARLTSDKGLGRGKLANLATPRDPRRLARRRLDVLGLCAVVDLVTTSGRRLSAATDVLALPFP